MNKIAIVFTCFAVLVFCSCKQNEVIKKLENAKTPIEEREAFGDLMANYKTYTIIIVDEYGKQLPIDKLPDYKNGEETRIKIFLPGGSHIEHKLIDPKILERVLGAH